MKPLSFEITSLLLHASLNLMLQVLKHLETMNGSLSCRSSDISKEPLGGVAGLLSEDLKAVGCFLFGKLCCHVLHLLVTFSGVVLSS